ncbi:AI-2E family transporter [Plantactinospora sp. KBS50]|uniref:AI-2E family transporter n=1 Tax=Plantactinospora sp. KBS50 TaxID=2024580 RepID=UPI000BAAAA13|nr:AI-2E family transporter [Plantactinospora sp. KBS50]ASW53913.1 AI-2E family transporter [Plantactinospora sp. KBS50]
MTRSPEADDGGDGGRDRSAAAGPDPSPLAGAEGEAARTSTDQAPLGRPGRPLDRRSPYLIGLLGAAGVATTYGGIELLSAGREVLVLIGLALFLAIGLDPPVRLLTRRMPRGLAIGVVTAGMLAVAAGFLTAAIPPLVGQTEQFVREAPGYLHAARDQHSAIGRLNSRFHLLEQAERLVAGGGGDVATRLLGAGRMVLGATAAALTVLVLTVYFLIDLPRIRRLIYRFFPHSRRPRAILIGDEVFTRVGGFVLGNLITSVIAGVGTFAWLLAFGVPYPLLLALTVALLDLIPVVGSTVGGIIVSLVALTVSFPVALATGAFYAGFRLAEDYLIVPKIVGRVVAVPATVTLVAVLLGAAVLGVVGALVAIPIAASIRIVLQETVFPRLDRS